MAIGQRITMLWSPRSGMATFCCSTVGITAMERGKSKNFTKKRALFRTAIVESCDGKEAGNVTKAERVVLNALAKTADLRLDICAFGESTGIVLRTRRSTSIDSACESLTSKFFPQIVGHS